MRLNPVVSRFGVVSACAALLLVPARRADAQSVQNIVLRNSFNPIGAGARGLGMGGAFIAVADDGTASSFNPAGLAQLRRSELAIVGFTSSLRSTISNNSRGNLSDVSRTDTHRSPDFVGLSVPFELSGRNLTVQLSYQRSVDLFGQGSATVLQAFSTSELIRLGLVDQQTVTRLRLDPITDLVVDVSPKQEGAFHTASLALGYQVTDRLALGASFNYWFANWRAEGTSTTRLMNGLFRVGQPAVELYRVQTRFDQEQSLRAFNANLGMLLKFRRVSLGATARLPFTGDYDLAETGTITQQETGRATATIPLDNDARARMRWPRALGAGIALRPFSKLTLSADVSKAYWSRAVIEDVPSGALLTPASADAYADRNFFDLDVAAQTSTRDTLQWRAGAEFLITTSRVIFPVRAGVYRDRSPISDLSNDEGREIEGLTAGIGLNFSSFVLDVGFERRKSAGTVGLRLSRTPTTTGPTTGATLGLSSENVREDRFVASLIYRFKGGDDDPIRKLFRFLFVGDRRDDEPVS